jgi:ParB family chromosome partitioning protein
MDSTKTNRQSVTKHEEIESVSIQTLAIEMLHPFREHPFNLYTGQRMDKLVESIRENSIIVPVVVREDYDNVPTYEILSGHNRVEAAKIVGLIEIPVRILGKMSLRMAKIFVIESNLHQRGFEDLSYSERAKTLAMYMRTLKSQGKRNDLTDYLNENYGTIHEKKTAREIVAEKYNLDPMTVTRYCRLSTLIPELLQLVDGGKMSFITGVNIATLDKPEQEFVFSVITADNIKLDIANSKKIIAKIGTLSEEKVRELLKKKSPKSHSFKIAPKVIKKFFAPDITESEIANIVETALAEFFSRKNATPVGSVQEYTADKSA